MSDSVATQRTPATSATRDLDPGLLRSVVIEDVEPQVDWGRFPVKRTVGEEVAVQASVLADGHDALAALVLFRRAGETEWRESPMHLLDNDRWQGSFAVDALGRYEYSVEA